MSLTSGRGPLGHRPAGRFVPPLPGGTVYVEPFRRRVRGVAGGRTVVDCERVLLVHRGGAPPTYAFPPADVGGAAAEPEPAAPGHVRVAWDAVDEWYEEEEQVHLHASNPYHRVECLRSARRLHVAVAGATLVDTADTVAVYETALEPRLYVAPRHVRPGLLVPSATSTCCPYKGRASYWTAELGAGRVEDVAWSYEEPLPAAAPLRGLLSFDAARARVADAFPA